MDRKKELRDLIEKIKFATGKGQEAISIEAGYKEKTLTQVLSSGANIDAAIRRLIVKFSVELHQVEINQLKVEVVKLNTVLRSVIGLISEMPERSDLKTKDDILVALDQKTPSSQKDTLRDLIHGKPVE